MPITFTPWLGKNKMKKMIMGALMGLVLVSFASAGLVGFLSNVVVGTIVVEGPVFWLDSGNTLMLNEKPSGVGSWNKLRYESFTEREWVMSEELGGIDFYDPKIEFVVEIRVDNLTDFRAIDLEFGFIKTNGDSRKICSTQFLNINENKVWKIPCNDVVTSPTNVDRFYFTASGMSDSSIEYEIKTKDSYVQITGVAQ